MRTNLFILNTLFIIYYVKIKNNLYNNINRKYIFYGFQN